MIKCLIFLGSILLPVIIIEIIYCYDRYNYIKNNPPDPNLLRNAIVNAKAVRQIAISNAKREERQRIINTFIKI